MPVAQWDESLATEHYAVDRQHQELIGMINALYDDIVAGRGKATTQETLKALSLYVVHHFAAEEELMTESGYPESAKHKAEHEKLTAKVGRISADYGSGALILSVSLARFLIEWFFHHIRQMDQRMISYVRTAGR